MPYDMTGWAMDYVGRGGVINSSRLCFFPVSNVGLP